MPQQEPVTFRQPIAEPDDWLEEPTELPPRPRRRLFGAGASPLALALLAVLLLACGFIGGALVEKDQNGSGSSSTAGVASSLASRLRALRAGASAGGGPAAAAAFASGPAGAAAGFTRPTAGTVAYMHGSTLYVTNAEGNTIKVTTSPGTSVSKTVNASLKGIHPGESVTITGATRSNGALSAESISVGSGAGGLAALFGGGGRGGNSSGGSGGSSGEPSLFGGG